MLHKFELTFWTVDLFRDMFSGAGEHDEEQEKEAEEEGEEAARAAGDATRPDGGTQGRRVDDSERSQQPAGMLDFCLVDFE